MQSIIIISKNKDLADKKIEEICIREDISLFDKNLTVFEKTAGIKEILEIQKNIFLKPLKSKSKAIIIEAPFGFTPQSQNSLLKILEEPPENTFIIISTSNKNDIIPTVLSRCQIIELKEEASYSKEDFQQPLEILKELLTSGVGQRLKLAQDISKSKDEMFLFLEKAIILCREEMIKNPKDNKYLKIIEKMENANNILKSTNATARLTLENLFLSL